MNCKIIFGGNIVSANLNSIYSSCINNTSYTQRLSTEKTINSKSTDSNLFATKLENEKKSDTYINDLKNCFPKTTVTVRSMTAKEVGDYREEWKGQPNDYSGFKHDIVVSSKVLEKMEKDPEYAEQMMKKIKKAAVPEGFGNATIYEYKVVVRDDGEIETWVCADCMNGKNKKVYYDNDDDKKKAEKKKLKLIYENKRIYEQWRVQALSDEKIKTNQFINQQYFFHAGVINKIRNEVINSK